MSRITRRIWIAAGAAAVALAIGVPIAIGTLTTASGKGQELVFVARQDIAAAKMGATFSAVPGAQLPVTVTGRDFDLILARFSAESNCVPLLTTNDPHSCTVRLAVYKQGTDAFIAEMAPAASADFAFDSTNRGSETGNSLEAHSMDRSIRLGPGAYLVRADWRTTDPSGNTSFRLDDWSLIVEQSD